MRAGVEGNNQKRRKIAREAIQAIALRAPQNPERRRKHIEGRSPHLVQDQDREQVHDYIYIKSQPERAANKIALVCPSPFFSCLFI